MKHSNTLIAAVLLVSLLALAGRAPAAPGSLDLSFGPGAGADAVVRALALQPDGRVLAGGDFTNFDGTLRHVVARLHTDGRLDDTFLPSPGFALGTYSMALQPDGKVIIGGVSSFVRRLEAGGALDPTFTNRATPVSFVHAVALQPDGKVLFGGLHFLARRLGPDGRPDAGFAGSTASSQWAQSIVLQPDGRVLVGGDFTTIGGMNRRGIARLNTDGAADPGFDPGTGADGTVYAIAVQADGRILIGGSFTAVNGASRGRIARLLPGGGVDGGFDPGGGTDGPVHAIVVQPDGYILVGGAFTHMDGTGRNRIARLKPDGKVDPCFDPGAGANDVVYALALQPDGRVLLGGAFTEVNEVPRERVARLWGNPALSIARAPPNVIVSWPSGFESFSLETSASPGGAWSPVEQTPADDGVRRRVVLSAGEGERVFRLRKP